MVSTDDIVEIVLDALKNPQSAPANFRKQLEQPSARKGKWGFYAGKPFNTPYTSLPAKRLFLSEYDIKLMLKGGKKELRVPRTAIVSPLAQEWLEFRGIKISRE